MTHRQFSKRPRIVATQETAQRAWQRRHPAYVRRGTGRQGLMREVLYLRYCLTCSKQVSQVESVIGPYRDAEQARYEEAHTPGSMWDWSPRWQRHAEGHEEIDLRLWGVRRIGGHLDGSAFQIAISHAVQRAVLDMSLDSFRGILYANWEVIDWL